MADASSPRPEIVEQAGVDAGSLAFIAWRHPLWRATFEGEPCVLKHQPPYRTRAEVEWDFEFLRRLAATGFPAPRPIRMFVDRGRVWTVVSWVEGRMLDWAPDPPLREVGAFVARYHDTVAGLTLPGDGPAHRHVDRVPPPPDGSPLAAIGHDVARRLPSLHARPVLPVHGDATTRNVIVDGDPVRCAGLIDFSAHRAPDVVDIGASLFQAGRPYFEATSLDPPRVADWVRGYASVRPLAADDAPLVVLTLLARGLLLFTRHRERGDPTAGAVERTLNISRDARRLEEVIARSVS